MSATYSCIEIISTASEWSRPAYLLQGKSVTATVLKVKVFLYSFKAKSVKPPPGPDGSADPPENAEPENYWNDPMLWTLMFH
jgi:hypothetical protein